MTSLIDNFPGGFYRSREEFQAKIVLSNIWPRYRNKLLTSFLKLQYFQVKLSNEGTKAIKDIENQNRASEAELAELKEATPEKQRELIEKKVKLTHVASC